MIPLAGSVPNWQFGINYIHGFYDGHITAISPVLLFTDPTIRMVIPLFGGAS